MYFLTGGAYAPYATCMATPLRRGVVVSGVRRMNQVIAKFHYTDPYGLFCGPGLRETRLGPCGSPTKSGGSGRARVVEFSL